MKTKNQHMKHWLSAILILSLLVSSLLSICAAALPGGEAQPGNSVRFRPTDHGKSRTNVTGGFGTLYSDIPALSFRSTQTTESNVNDGITVSGFNEVNWKSELYDALVLDVEFVNAGKSQGVVLQLEVYDTVAKTTRTMYSLKNGTQFYRLPMLDGADAGLDSLIETASNYGWMYASAKGYGGAGQNNHKTSESFLGKFIVPFTSLETGFSTQMGSNDPATAEEAINLQKDRIVSVSLYTVLKWSFQYMNMNLGSVSLGKMNRTNADQAVLSNLTPVWEPVNSEGIAAVPYTETAVGNTYRRYGNDPSCSIFLFTRPGIHFAATNNAYETVDFQFAKEMVSGDGTVNLNEYDGFLLDMDLSEYRKNQYVHYAFGLFNSSSGANPVTNDRWYSGKIPYYYIPDGGPAFYNYKATNGMLADTRYGKPEQYVGKIFFPFDASGYSKGSSAGNFPKGQGETSANLIRFWFQCSANYRGTVYFRDLVFVKDINRYMTEGNYATTPAQMNRVPLAGNAVKLKGKGSGDAVATFRMNSYYEDYRGYGSYCILEKSDALAIRLKNPTDGILGLKVTVWESSSEQLDLCDASRTSEWKFLGKDGREELLEVKNGYVELPAGCDGVLAADYRIAAKITENGDGKVNGGIWNLLLTLDMSRDAHAELIVGEITSRQSGNTREPFYVPLKLEGNNDPTVPTDKYSWIETETVKIASYGTAKEPVGYRGVQETHAVNGTFRIRLIAGVDSLDYDLAGMKLSVTDSAGTRYLDQKIATVYTSLTGEGEGGLETYTAADLGGSYLMAVVINHVPASGTVSFTVTPYGVSGAVMTEGETYRLTYVDGVLLQKP